MASFKKPAIDESAAIERLMRFLSVEGVTGHEAAIAREVVADLRRAGVAKSAIRHDSAHERIPLPTECGNLIVQLPGTREGPHLLFSAHLDTVPLAAGARPVRSGTKIHSAGSTALGGDNRTGCAVLATLAETLIAHKIPHPPITLLFTVREESGLFGARHLDPSDLGGPVMGFNFDSRDTAEVTIGAVGAERWSVEIQGKAAHAGVHPEKGISATAVASLAIARMVDEGWFGKVVKNRASLGDKFKRRASSAENSRGTDDVELVRGTSNVGRFGGPDGRSAGEATNVVTDYVLIQGESRSHNAAFARAITAAYKDSFRAAARRLPDDQGRTAKVLFRSRLDYHPFRLKENAPVVRRACAVVRGLGLEPIVRVANGGLDANWLVRHGIPTVTLGAGQNAIHTVDEFVDVTEYVAGCRLAVALASQAAGE